MTQSNKRVVIIGTGLGGLLTGAYLAMTGRDVTLLEELSLVGGRFTHIDYEGFAVPTGAFHTLPGGTHGPIYTCLRMIGMEPELVETSPSFRAVIDGRAFPLYVQKGESSGIREAVGLESKSSVAARMAVVMMKNAFGLDTSVARLVKGLSPGDRAVRLFDHLTKFSAGVPAESASVLEILRSLRIQKFGLEGFIRHGNRSLVTGILDKAQASGAALRMNTRVERIAVRDGQAYGVYTEDGNLIEADIVVSNAGAARTAHLLGDAAPSSFVDRIRRAVPAYGVAHSLRCRRPMHNHNSIEIPVDLDYISGIAPISNVCPELCPEGWHYSLAYQALDADSDVSEQLDSGISELAGYIGSDIEVFNSAIYRNGHPSASISQSVGQHGSSRFPSSIPSVRNMYLVGHDVSGYGTAAEVIGDSCRRLWRRLA